MRGGALVHFTSGQFGIFNQQLGKKDIVWHWEWGRNFGPKLSRKGTKCLHIAYGINRFSHDVASAEKCV